MSKRLHDTKLNRNFEKQSNSKEEKREKQDINNDLKRLSNSDIDLGNDDTYDELDND